MARNHSPRVEAMLLLVAFLLATMLSFFTASYVMQEVHQPGLENDFGWVGVTAMVLAVLAVFVTDIIDKIERQ